MFDKIDTFFSISGAAQHILHLLQTQGATAIDAVRQLVAGVKAFTGRDYVGVFAALNAEEKDVEAIIAAVKAEFALN